jgi:hypothetical protein
MASQVIDVFDHHQPSGEDQFGWYPIGTITRHENGDVECHPPSLEQLLWRPRLLGLDPFEFLASWSNGNVSSLIRSQAEIEAVAEEAMTKTGGTPPMRDLLAEAAVRRMKKISEVPPTTERSTSQECS